MVRGYLEHNGNPLVAGSEVQSRSEKLRTCIVGQKKMALFQSYLVLNLCRILHTVIHGEPGSKTAAGPWTKATYPQWKSLIEDAEKWAYGDKMKRQADAVAFLRLAAERVNETKLL